MLTAFFQHSILLTLRRFINPSKLAWVICGLVLIVAPVSLAAGGLKALAWGLFIGFLNGGGPRQNFVQSISTGLIAGFSTTLTFDVPEIALFGSLVALGTGLAATLAAESEIDRSRLLFVALVGLFMGISMSAGFIYSKGFWEALPITIVLVGISTPGVTLGIFIGLWLRPRLVKFADVWLYLREMGVFLIGFAFGYLGIALIFAAWFWSLWKVSPIGSFNGLPTGPKFGHFFYFSVITIGTLGYGDITPQSPLARALAISEVIIGIGWITVVFAAVISHLQPRLTDIAARRNARLQEMEEEKEYLGIALEIDTIMVSDTEDAGRGVYATIRNDYAKNSEGKTIIGKEYGFYLWGPRIRGSVPTLSGFRTKIEAEEAARQLYQSLNL